MLGTKRCLATVAVKDLEAAERFYGDTLGLEVSGREGHEAISFRTGDSSLLVYRSQYAGTNRATCVTWIAGDEIDSLATGLDARGVAFLHYDMPGMQRTGHIHSAGDHRVAWFEDPDGNIHSLVSG